MAARRHKNDTRTFAELTFAEQAKSVSATILQLQRAIDAHSRNPAATPSTRLKCINQVSRLLERLSTTSRNA
jgi:hypothetical protein